MAIGLPCPAGIEPTGNVVKQRAEFTVETISAGQGDVSVYVEDPEGHREEVSGAAGGGAAVGLGGWRWSYGAGCEVVGLAVRLWGWL